MWKFTSRKAHARALRWKSLATKLRRQRNEERLRVQACKIVMVSILDQIALAHSLELPPEEDWATLSPLNSKGGKA